MPSSSHGKTSEINLSGIFSSITPIKDRDGNYIYAIASIEEITSKKTIGQTKQMVIDSNCGLHDDVTGQNPLYFKKLSNNGYYNTSNNVIYDSNLLPSVYLTNSSPRAYSDGFFCVSNGKYGYVDYNGVVKLKFEYDSILRASKGTKVVCGKDGKFYVCDISNGTTTQLVQASDGSNPVFPCSTTGLYYLRESDAYKFYDLSLQNPIKTVDGLSLTLQSIDDPLNDIPVVIAYNKTSNSFYGFATNYWTVKSTTLA